MYMKHGCLLFSDVLNICIAKVISYTNILHDFNIIT